MDNQNNRNNKNNKQGFGIIIITTLIAAVIVLGLYQFYGKKSTSKEIAYSEFLKMVDDGKVEEVRIGANELIITPKRGESSRAESKIFYWKSRR